MDPWSSNGLFHPFHKLLVLLVLQPADPTNGTLAERSFSCWRGWWSQITVVDVVHSGANLVFCLTERSIAGSTYYRRQPVPTWLATCQFPLWLQVVFEDVLSDPSQGFCGNVSDILRFQQANSTDQELIVTVIFDLMWHCLCEQR